MGWPLGAERWSPSTRSRTELRAVSIRIGTGLRLRNRRHTSIPDIVGSITSRINRSGLSARGLGWQGFFEALPRRGYTGGDRGNYIRHHNPFVYFRSVTSHPHQLRHLRKMRAFRPSLRRPPALSFIVPNNAHNMHDGPICAGDRWLSTWIPRVTHSRAYRQHGGVIIIVWDEGHNDSEELVSRITVASATRLRWAGLESRTAWSHAHTTRRLETGFSEGVVA